MLHISTALAVDREEYIHLALPTKRLDSDCRAPHRYLPLALSVDQVGVSSKRDEIGEILEELESQRADGQR